MNARTALPLVLAAAPALPAAAQSPGDVRWATSIEGEAYANPTVAPDGRIYYGTHLHGGILYEIDPDDGSILRSVEAPGAVEHAVALSDDGYLYLVTVAGALADGHAPAQTRAACFDVETLSLQWSSPLPAGSDNSPVLGNGRVYHGCVAHADHPDPLPGKHFLAWDAATGDAVIEMDVEGWGATPGVVDEEGRVFFGVEDITDWPEVPEDDIWPGRFYALGPDDPAAGSLEPTPLWTFEAEGDFGSPVACSKGVVYTTCRDGNLYGFRAEDGHVMLRRDLGAPSWSGIAIGVDPQTQNEVLYTGTLAMDTGGGGDRTLYAIEVDGTFDGELQWSVQLELGRGGFTFGTPALDDLGNIYTTTGAGWVQARDRSGALLWEYELPGGPQSGAGGPTILDDGTIVVGSNGSASSPGTLYAFYGNGNHLADDVPWPKYKHDLRNTGNVRTPIRDTGATVASVAAVSAATGGAAVIEGGWLSATDTVLVDGLPAQVLDADFHSVTIQVDAQEPGFADVAVTGALGATTAPDGLGLLPNLALEPQPAAGLLGLTLHSGDGGLALLWVAPQTLGAPLDLGPEIHHGLELHPGGLVYVGALALGGGPTEEAFSLPDPAVFGGTTWFFQGLAATAGLSEISFTNVAVLAL